MDQVQPSRRGIPGIVRVRVRNGRPQIAQSPHRGNRTARQILGSDRRAGDLRRPRGHAGERLRHQQPPQHAPPASQPEAPAQVLRARPRGRYRADRIGAYAVARRAAGAANASINRETATLRHAFKLAVDAERLSRIPRIKRLEEGPARQGFLEHADFVALREALPENLRDPVVFPYLSGWRVSEMKSLEWRDVDLDGGVIGLAPEKSKNAEGRTLPISGELADVMARAHAARRLDCAAVFHRYGRPLRDFRGAWALAATKAGLGHLLVHDLRRCAIRNLVRAGVGDHVAMKLSGHKTRAIFNRYNIVSEADLTAATERRDQYLSERPTERKVTSINSQRRE